jgi:hypothetical protein
MLALMQPRKTVPATIDRDVTGRFGRRLRNGREKTK